MPFIYDRIKETTTTAGTGAITLAGAVAGFRSLSSVLSNTQTGFYVIENPTANEWECGIGTLNSSTGFARTSITSSSSTGSTVNFSAGTKYIWLDLTTNSFSRMANDYILIQDQKSSGTNGGTSTSGSWQTHDLNNELVDTGNHCSLSSNQITLQPGTYEFDAWAVFNKTDGHQLRIQNITSGVTIALGGNNFGLSTLAVISTAIVKGRTTISSAATFELQYRVGTGTATNGLGAANSWGTEVYAEALIRREVN